MVNPHVRALGTLKTVADEPDDFPVTVGVDYELVTIAFAGHSLGLTRRRAGEFAQLFVAACWEAASNAEEETQ